MNPFEGKTLSWQQTGQTIELALHREPLNEIGSGTLDELERFAEIIEHPNLNARVLVIHGAQDNVCPEQDGRDIAAACGGRLVSIPEAGHNDLWTEPHSLTTCTQTVQEFIGNRKTSSPERP